MNDSLEKIFAGYRPDLGDSDKYMAELEKKLIVAEYFKRERNRLRFTAVVACIIGSIVGGIAVTFFFTHPVDIPSFDFSYWFSTNFKLIIPVVLGCTFLGWFTAYYLEKA